jgi:hypothetical protein
MKINKHVTIAMIIAPILAVIAYFATDRLVGEKPQAAQAGKSYSLVALPNCRYASGHCTLKNAGFVIELTVDQVGVNVLTLHAQSKHPLQGVKVALVTPAQRNATPTDLIEDDESRLSWHIKLQGTPTTDSQIQLVAAAEGAFYFGEAGLSFVDYETSFGEDFRH